MKNVSQDTTKKETIYDVDARITHRQGSQQAGDLAIMRRVMTRAAIAGTITLPSGFGRTVKIGGAR